MLKVKEAKHLCWNKNWREKHRQRSNYVTYRCTTRHFIRVASAADLQNVIDRASDRLIQMKGYD